VLLNLLVVGCHIFEFFLVDHQKLAGLVVLFLKIVAFDFFCAKLQLESVQLLSESFFCFFKFVELEIELGSDVGISYLYFFCFFGNYVIGDSLHF